MQDNEKMDTLVECLEFLRKKGYTKEFKIEQHTMHAIDDTEKNYSPEQVKITGHYRFEGESDPADMTVLYALETEDGDRGTLIDAFGAYSSQKVSEYLRKVEEIGKAAKE
jgi:hypothetical protein